MKGDNGDERDNKENAVRIARLRGEKARLLGYTSHAAFVLENNMAKTPERVDAFLKELWDPTLVKAREEADALQALADRELGAGKIQIASWDW